MDYAINRISSFFIKEFADSFDITIAVSAIICLSYLLLLELGAANQKKINWKSVFVGLLLGVSMAGILNLTLFNRAYTSSSNHWQFSLFWSYKEVIFHHDRSLAIEILCNILLFVPFGMMLTLGLKRFRGLFGVLLASFIFSFSVELLQGVFQLGLFEWDDMINNTLGGGIGWAAGRIVWVAGARLLHINAGQKEYGRT